MAVVGSDSFRAGDQLDRFEKMFSNQLTEARAFAVGSLPLG
jgi:hypothetical protein